MIIPMQMQYAMNEQSDQLFLERNGSTPGFAGGVGGAEDEIAQVRET